MAIDTLPFDAALLAIFGEDFTYTPFGGSATPVTCFFQSPDETPDALTVEFTTTGPIALGLSTDFPNPTKQDTLLRVLDSQLYEVKDFEVDEASLVVLELEELP